MENLNAYMVLHDIIILQSVTFDRANIRFGSYKDSKITAKVHEYILIFKKLGQNENDILK
jgi:hypothetical protein